MELTKKTDPESGNVYLSEHNPYNPPEFGTIHRQQKRRFALGFLLLNGAIVAFLVYFLLLKN